MLAGRTGLPDLAALVSAASLVISNDTGVSHLAVAYGIPSVTLFGPVSPALWGPPAGAGRHVALWKGTGGRPGDPHGDQVDPRLLRIRVRDVLAGVRNARELRHPVLSRHNGAPDKSAAAPPAAAASPPRARG